MIGTLKIVYQSITNNRTRNQNHSFRNEQNSFSTARPTPAPERERVDSYVTKFSVKVASLNIRRVKHKFLELCIFLDTLPSNPEVLCLQETWTSK